MSDRDGFSLVRTILFRDWDPADVNENDHLADEYDDYIPSVIHLLSDDCSVDQLAGHLNKIEKECLESDLYKDRAEIAARNLIQAWNSRHEDH